MPEVAGITLKWKPGAYTLDNPAKGFTKEDIRAMQNNATVKSLFPSADTTTQRQVQFYPENFQIESVEHLLFAEEILDSMDANLVDKVHYVALHTKAETYIKGRLELLTKPWLRAAGAVHDIIETLRQERGIATPTTASSHCH